MSALAAYRRAVGAGGYRDGAAELFLAAWEALEADYLAVLEAAAAGAAGWREAFRRGAAATLELVESEREAARFMVLEAHAAGELGRSRQRGLAERLAGLLDAARAELEDPEAPAPGTAGWICAIFYERIYRRLTAPGGPELTAQLPELLFLAVSAYFGTEAGLRELL